MILERIQHYLGIVFFTTLVLTQALIFVAVSAANNDSYLPVVFVEPVIENIDIGDSIYFQAMISEQVDQQYDLVYFNLKNPLIGLDENYQASLSADGTWLAQSAWDTNLNYQPGQYYLSVVAHKNSEGIPTDIYYSDSKLINLNGQIQASASGDLVFFAYPTASDRINAIEQSILTAVLYVDSTISADIEGLTFNLIGQRIENGEIVFFSIPFDDEAQQIDVDVTLYPNHKRWEASIDLAEVEDGRYNIKVESLISGELALPAPQAFEVYRSFEIYRSEEFVEVPGLEEIISPIQGQEISMTDNMLIEVSVRPAFADLYTIIAEVQHETAGTILRLPLQSVPGTSSYRGIVDFDGTEVNEEGWAVNLADIVFAGEYNISFYMVDLNNPNASDIGVGRVGFTLTNNTIPELVYEINLNTNLPNSGIDGDSLALDFETSFSADSFDFTIVKEGESTIGTLKNLPLVGDGTSWVYNLSAAENDFSNGRYVLNARAFIDGEVLAELTPITFIWNITEEEESIEPSLAVHVVDSDFHPDSILIGSANVLSLEFILQDTINEEKFYSFIPNTVDCADSNIINESIREAALTLEHNHCFYYVLGSSDTETIDNGNYRLWLQRLSTTEPVVISTKHPISYFDENNQVEENVVFDLYEPHMGSFEEKPVLSFPFLTNLVQYNIQPQIFTIDDNQFSVVYNFINEEWEALEVFGISEVDNQNLISPQLLNIYLENIEGDNLFQDGDYYIYVKTTDGLLETDKIYFTVKNRTLLNDQTDVEQDEQQAEEIVNNEDNQADEDVENLEEPINASQRSVTIDYYSTCVEQGISNQEICMRFRATMDLLDPTCVEQGIYEAPACEDYLYRIETDLECQQNNVLDREDCKNYLLEKYGGQVDCQLADINLCNSVLRNEYLNRLVTGQRLSNSINQAVESLLGQNISTQDLSDRLKQNGINSQELLPLSPNQETRILVARAQKETVLEEKDKLTILNQAVIILDADGDGLSDDMESYYGTDINNKDSDGDSYSDGEEINNGYDPLGPGKLIKERTDFDRVTLDANKNIEQPKSKSKKIDKRMEVAGVDTSEDNLKLSGKGEANTWVNIYLYSGLPLVMTTKTDASGNWSYDIKHSVTDGHHRVFVTVNDDTGKIVKQSRPISFLIRGAQAVTANDYFDESSSSTAVNNLFIYYILGGAFLVFLALGAIIYLHKGKNQNLEV